MWAVAFVAAYRPVPAIILACLAVITGMRPAAALVRFLPILGNITQNVVTHVAGSDTETEPLVIVAHVDTHPTARSPMSGLHAALGGALGWVALAAAVFGPPGLAAWRVATAVVAAEGIVTLMWLAKRELTVISEMPDDNTSGLLALTSFAELLRGHTPVRDVWIVGSGAGTSGSHGLTAFLGRYELAQRAWVVEIDALGEGEVVASPLTSRFPRPGTPPQLVRAIVAAARESGDPLTVRRVRRSHSDARAALSMRTGALALTGGLGPPSGGTGPDAANAERAARVVDRLARSAG